MTSFAEFKKSLPSHDPPVKSTTEAEKAYAQAEEEFVDEVDTIAKPSAAYAATRILGGSNPLSIGASVLADAHNAGKNHPIVTASRESQPPPNIPLGDSGLQIPVGDVAHALTPHILQTMAGAGNMLDSVSPATISSNVKESIHNPYGLPINPETGMPMATQRPPITGISATPPVPKVDIKDLLSNGIY